MYFVKYGSSEKGLKILMKLNYRGELYSSAEGERWENPCKHHSFALFLGGKFIWCVFKVKDEEVDLEYCTEIF